MADWPRPVGGAVVLGAWPGGSVGIGWVVVGAYSAEAVDDGAGVDDQSGGVDVAVDAASFSDLDFVAGPDVAADSAFDGQVGGEDSCSNGALFFDDDVAASKEFAHGFIGFDLVILEDESLAAVGAEDGHGFICHFHRAGAIGAEDDFHIRWSARRVAAMIDGLAIRAHAGTCLKGMR